MYLEAYETRRESAINRLQENKDEKYDLMYAIDILENRLDKEYLSRFYLRNLINEAFYKGNQWVFEEDLDGFLLDENGDTRNRIKFVQNIIKPHIEQFRGYAIKMSIDARATPTSPHSISRKIEKLKELEFVQEFAENNPYMKPTLQKKFGIGDTMDETESSFNAIYVDKLAFEINKLIRRVASNNDFEELKKSLALNIALHGLAVVFEDDRINSQVFKKFHANQYIWDTSAKRDDHADAEYQGIVEYYTFSKLLEEYQGLGEEEKIILENVDYVEGDTFPHITGSPTSSFRRGRIPVYKIYWDDIEIKEIGCVIENELYCLRYITEDGQYTSKDLVTPPDGFYEDLLENVGKEASERNKSNRVTVDCTRFCHFVYGQFVGYAGGNIVLKSGQRPFSSKYSHKHEYNDKGFKCYCWSLVGGDILTPIDDVIDIQRYINRLNSVAEAQTNNARGSGMVYDKDMVGAGEEDEFLRNVNAGKPVGVNANGQLNNRISSYDSTLKNGTVIIHNIAQVMKQVAMDSFGGAALQGVGDGVRVSVGAVNQNLNQAMIMQEPFFYCLSKVMMQCYAAIAGRGKRIYARTGEVLMDTVGDYGSRAFVITEEEENEEYNIEILRANDQIQSRQEADAALLGLLQAQIIDQDTMAKYYGTIAPQDLGMVIREARIKTVEAAKVASRQQAIQAEGNTQLQQSMVDQNSVDKERAYDEQNSQETQNRMAKIQETMLRKNSQKVK